MVTVAARFDLGNRRGSGGMGAIYQAVDRATGRTVAVKLLHEHQTDEVDRFEQEAELLATLEHDAIVRYVAHGRTAEGMFLAMEWLDGEDLTERLERAALTPAETVEMLARIAEALGVAHRRGIVHRDVKPSNIFLPGGDPTRAKLLDFGVARTTVTTRPMTQLGTALGTPGYMAPEQARGDRDLDARVDVFAMGAVLFRCLAGRAPFDAANTIAVLTRVLFEEPPPLWIVRPDLPASIHELVARALAKPRDRRHADGDELARALRDLAPELATAEAPTAAAAGITGGEDRILAAVLVRRPHHEPPPAERHAAGTMATVAVTVDPDVVVAMRQAAVLRGSFERLVDGTWATVFSGDGATEMSARAARFALFIRERFPGAQIAVATGRRRGSGTVSSNAFDHAARLVTAAPAGTVLIDDGTAALLTGRHEIERRAVGTVLIGETDAIGRQVRGVVTPFVGRGRELRLLRGAWDSCVEDGQPAVVLVVGAPGTGKSRLIAELVGQLERDGAVVWRGYGDSLATSAPFGPVAQILRRALGLLDSRTAPMRHEAIEHRVRQVVVGEAVTRISAAVAELLDPTAADGIVDPVARGDQIRRAVEDWIAGEAGRAPLALILDDAHWLDPGTVALVDGVLRNVTGPVFILAGARPEIHERFARLWSDRGLTKVELSALSPQAAGQLAKAVLGDRATTRAVSTLAEKSGGNPFFLEELVRVRGDTDSGEWPETVLATVEARLARIDGDARRMLRAASVIGPVFWPGAVTHLVGGPPFAAAVASRLESLVEREFIVPTEASRFAGERQFAFRHGLIRDAAYGTLPDDDRRLAHRLAADWLDRAGEAPVVVAQHLERAGEPATAVPYFVRAIEAALIGDDVAGALTLCDRGVAAGATGTDLGALRAFEAEAAWWRGEHPRAIAAGAEALALVPPRTSRWYAVLGVTARAAGALGSATDLEDLTGRLLAQPPTGDARAAAVVAGAQLAGLFVAAGDQARLRKLLGFVQGNAARLAPSDPALGWVEALRHQHAMRDGDLGRATRAVEKAIAAYAAAGDLRNLCLQRMHLGASLTQIGQLEAAIEALRRALVDAERLGAAYTAARARQHLGHALIQIGRFDEAVPLLTAARHAFAEQGDQRAEAAACADLADACAGRPLEAETWLRAAVALVAHLPPMRAALSAQLGRLLVARGATDEALALTRPAHELIESGGPVEEREALVRLAHVEALVAAGAHDEAVAVAWVAVQRLRTRAARLGDPAWSESFLRRVPANAETVRLAALLDVGEQP